MNRLIFTGTAPGYPSPRRACSSFVIKTGQDLYQFDAGEGFAGSALQHNIRPDNIAKIFVSHLHPDHVTGLFLELQWLYLEKRTRSLDIYVPDEAVAGLNQAADLFYLFKEKFPFNYRFKSIKPGRIYNGRNIAVHAFHNNHLKNNAGIIRKFKKSNKTQSYGFIIRSGGKRIIYSGDLDRGDDLTKLLRGTHTVIAEGMHTDIAVLLKQCVDHNIRRLVLTHLLDDVFDNQGFLQSEARRIGFKNLVVARDGLILPL